jgi:hypothetical protein
MTFRTKLDYSDNRQIKQRERTNTILSGTTTFGVPFSGLTYGPNMSATAQTSQYFGVVSSYSGNSATTVFNWSIPNVSAIDSSVSALTPSNSGVSQNINAVFGSNSSTIIDGNLVNLTYSGVGATNLYPITMSEPTPGNYTGTVSTDFFIYSAQSLDFTGRTIWIDNTEILRTKKLILSENPIPGYVLTSDSEGMATWQSISAVTSGTTFWSASTGTFAIVTESSGNLASGNYSLAEGYQTSAIGNYSHAEGYITTALGANASHAEGWFTTAFGNNSHAEGDSTKAIGPASHSEGNAAIASGNSSHAEGYQTTTIGDGSHAEGTLTTAIGDFSHAEGINTTTTGNYSHAEGGSTIASGDYSHAEGEITTSSGIRSHAEGLNTIASGSMSHAEGLNTIASGSMSHTEGNATTASNTASHAEGTSTIASGLVSHAEGGFTKAIGTASHAEGYFTTASSLYSHAEGYLTTAIGDNSHAEGNFTTASGSASHAEGQSTIASGFASHSEGNSTTAFGNFSHAGGTTTLASGLSSFVHGQNSQALNTNTIVLGGLITGTTSDTTYVDYLNVKRVLTTAFLNDIRIDANGNLTTNTSDERLKENITPITGALNIIKSLSGVNYQWKDRNAGGDNIKLGFIAQEVEKVEPKLVFTNKVDGYKGLHIDGVIPLLVEAVKELTNPNKLILETQTIAAEDNNIELNYNGNNASAIGGGISIINGIDDGIDAEFKLNIEGSWVTNNPLAPSSLIIPEYTPISSYDIYGKNGDITRDENYLYVRDNNTWKRSPLQMF